MKDSSLDEIRKMIGKWKKTNGKWKKLMENEGKLMENEGKLMENEGKLLENEGKLMEKWWKTNSKPKKTFLKKNLKNHHPFNKERDRVRAHASAQCSQIEECRSMSKFTSLPVQEIVAKDDTSAVIRIFPETWMHNDSAICSMFKVCRTFPV